MGRLRHWVILGIADNIAKLVIRHDAETSIRLPQRWVRIYGPIPHPRSKYGCDPSGQATPRIVFALILDMPDNMRIQQRAKNREKAAEVNAHRKTSNPAAYQPRWALTSYVAVLRRSANPGKRLVHVSRAKRIVLKPRRRPTRRHRPLALNSVLVHISGKQHAAAATPSKPSQMLIKSRSVRIGRMYTHGLTVCKPTPLAMHEVSSVEAIGRRVH
jgi:hypothetical protein